MKRGAWADWEDDLLRACPSLPHEDRGTVAVTPLQRLAKRLDRSVGTLYARRRRLGIAQMPKKITKREPKGVNTDAPIDRPERPCARCGNTFQPTVKRRLLCYPCFTDDGRSLE